ncbi:MAG: DUF2520 domain-containing protein [Chitinophagaceae bacterium]|nr:DUF2520 domain-containing protein [Chitinophagaceae bacterium]MCW5905850.1 DUF2520 domain-containing protein [Chitinophagaceae bacterium]
MKVVIIGSGNVATILALKLQSKGYNIIQVYSQELAHAKILANKLHTNATNDVKEIVANADLYLLAVADKAVPILAEQLLINANAIVVHTAGSISIKVLEKCSKNYGVLYPIQSIRKNMDIDTPIPFAIDGSNETVIETLTSLAKNLQEKVVHFTDEQRLKLHVAAVIASNFVNYLYKESATICHNEQIDFSILQPLIEETALRLRNYPPADVFTGPAVRKDYTTIDKHLQLLQNYPEQLALYQFITERILQNKI